MNFSDSYTIWHRPTDTNPSEILYPDTTCDMNISSSSSLRKDVSTVSILNVDRGEIFGENITKSGNQLVKTPEIQKLKQQEIRGKKI